MLLNRLREASSVSEALALSYQPTTTQAAFDCVAKLTRAEERDVRKCRKASLTV